MKKLARIGFVALLLVSLTSSVAVARDFRGHGFNRFHHSRQFHHRGHATPFFFGLGVGALVTAPFWYPYSYPVYAPPAPAPAAPVYWYYCQNPPGYYPYVAECPGGWMPVVPPTSAP